MATLHTSTTQPTPGAPRCYVLGGHGFVGSAFCREARARGYEVRAIGRAEYPHFAGSACDLLIHAHGSSRKYVAWQHPQRDYEASVACTERTLKDFRARRHVLVSSIDVYPQVSSPAACVEDVAFEAGDIESPYGRNKFLAEQRVREGVEHWTIVRVGGLVGEGLKKNSVHDLLKGNPLWVHPDSGYQYMDSADLARLTLDLEERLGGNTLLNMTGDGVLTLREVASWLPGASLGPEDEAKRLERYEVSMERLKALVAVPNSREAVRRFVEDVRSGRRHLA